MKQANAKKEIKPIVYPFRVHPLHLDKLRRIAKKNRRGISAELAYILDKAKEPVA